MYRPIGQRVPAPAVHAGDPAAVFGARRRHRRDGRDPRAQVGRRASAGLYGDRLLIAVAVSSHWSTCSARATASIPKRRVAAGAGRRRRGGHHRPLGRGQDRRRRGARAGARPTSSRAMSNNDILAVMFFALFFGIGLLLVQTTRHRDAEGRDRRRVRSGDEADRHRHPARARSRSSASCSIWPRSSAGICWSSWPPMSAVVLLALAIQMFGVYPALLALHRQEEPARLLPRDPRGEPDGVFDRQLQRHAAHRAARRRQRTRSCRAGSRASC